MPLGLFSRKSDDANAARDFVPAPTSTLPADPLARALQLGRLGLILARPAEWAARPDFQQVLGLAMRAVDERFALVPEGLATIPLTIYDQPGQPEQDFETQPFLLARHAVTNAQFQSFVDDGGYENLEHWPQDVWPHLINFKDQTGVSAPRFWREGRHDSRFAQHPVVGVCYYEAEAFARWAGLRLPTESEWQMAASWRLRTTGSMPRRYPWGDGLDLDCCNIWASGHGHTLPVNACEAGAAPNGVLQLIGNVWEWTSSDFEATDRDGRAVVGDTLLKSVRGGAFDTYFPWQATSDFRTGLSCMVRTNNTGLRCALNLPPG